MRFQAPGNELKIGCGPWLQREVAAADWLKGRLFPVSTSSTKGMIEEERVLRSSNREAAAMRSNVELHSEAADVPAAASDCARHPNCSNRFDTFVRADCQSDRLVPRIS